MNISMVTIENRPNGAETANASTRFSANDGADLKRNHFKWIPVIAVFMLVFFPLQRLLVPKYASSSYEGAMVASYYHEPKEHDVLFIGDCEVYSNISPITLWENYGITSFIRGSAQQLIWHSYYLLEDTLRYEKPDAVVFNTLSMRYGKPQHEPYNRMALDGMRLSPVKLKAISASLMEGESFLSYLFPVLRFHDRWTELKKEDIKYFFTTPRVAINGFMIRSDVKPVDYIPPGLPLHQYEFNKKTWHYLNKMKNLCEKNDISLILMKAPVIYPHWYSQWDEQMVDYAVKNGLLYINFLLVMDEIGLDLETDSFNAGLHLNVYGAEKLTHYLGGILKNEYKLPDRRNDPILSARWEEKIKLYNDVIRRQQNELDNEGRITTFIIGA